MKHAITIVAATLAALALTGCMSTPTSIVSMPMTARPLEDRRARHVGDVLTLVITERTTANKTGASSGNKSGSVSVGIPKKLQSTFGNPLAVDNTTTYADGDNQSASNAFTGTMGVTVVEVLSNGNLIVAGEKQVAMNKGVEYIRFSGMVNPDNIATGNTVQSTAVSDAKVEYRTSSQIDRAELSSMASRFFQSLLPF